MICEKVQVSFNEYIDGTLNEEDVVLIDAHCKACETCSVSLENFKSLYDSLAALPVPPNSDGFEQRVINAAIKDAQVSPDKYFTYNNLYKFSAAAMIAAVVIFLGVFNEESAKAPYLFAVGDDVRTIKVAIDSEQALEVVQLRVELSDNLELAGFGSKREVHWTTNLREGVNVISLPIVGIAQGQGDITTRVHLNGKEKVMRIKTQYKNPGSVLLDNDTVLQG